MEEDPSTLLTPTLTATNSGAFSPAKRPYHSRDDTLPSPPPPPLCSYEVPGVLHTAPFGRSLSQQWMSPENTGVAEWDAHDSERKLLDAEGRSTLGSSDVQLHWQHRQAAVLTSLAAAEDSVDAAMFSTLAGGDGSKVSPVEPLPTNETSGGALLHTPEAATMTREKEAAVSHQLSHPFPISALTTSTEATPQQSDLLPRSSTTASPSTAKSASSPTSGNASPEMRCISSVARAALSTVKLNLQVEVPKFRLQQTERAVTSQVALFEEARMENEELRQQLGALLLIQEELERRCQQREAVTGRAEQRHESEIKVLELEKEQALAQLRESYEEQLQALRDAEVVAQSNVDALAKEVVTLRRQLSVTQQELRASMEEQLECQRQSDEAISRQARMEAECVASQAAAADAQAKITAQLSELRRKLWATEERASAAELALQSLCSQLTAAAENTLAGATAGADVEVEENCEQDETADAKPVQCCLTSKNFKGAEATAAPVVFDEAAVLSAVLSVMEDSGIGTTLPSPLRSSSEMGGKETAERSPYSSTCTSMKNEALLSQDQLTAPLLPPSADTCSAPIRAHLSNAARLRCRQHRELIQSVLARVSDAYQRVARRSATDARLCAVEHVLFKEIKEWRARLDERHQRLPSNERARQDDGSHAHGGDAAGCQAPHSISTRRCSVGVVTDAVDSFNAHVTKVAAAAALQREETGAKAAYEETLAESQRQLRYERSYIVQLQNEIQSLRTSNNAATVLESLTNTLQTLRAAVCRLVRDAVADMQRLYGQRSQRLQAAATNIGGFASEMVFREDTGHLLRRRWRSMHEADTHRLKSSSSAGETDDVTCATIALPSYSPLLDFAFVRAVHKSILRAEALIEKVSTTLLRENDRVFAHAHALFGAYKEDQGSVCATCAPTRSHMMSFSARDAVQDSWSGANRAGREVSSHRVAEEGGTSYRGDIPLVPPWTAFSAATGNRTAHQQKVYAEMRDLLHRSAASHYDVPAPAISASHHSRAEPLWLLGAQPQQARPSGMNVSPTPQRSPYVAAYFTGPAEFPRVDSSYVLLDSAETPATVAADARLGFAQLADAMQELRNVGRVLDNIRDAEETREEKWQQCLQHWQGAILEAVDGVRERIESALTLLRRPEVEGVVAGDTMNNETSAHVTSTLKAISRGICAHSVCDELERAPERQRVPRSVSQEMKSPVVPPHGPSRLAEALSGKMRSKADEAALLSA
ncbi:hypothetical protein, unknown function [Leishmania tarentolae]|uniref:Uncharacterized protein n=1 Tax=Leishmania tarentolae TaxID=5689 RepID=A0A640KRH7_LEITA|nr:hypothetical protein, unknown function [Leishmania tarentolae]